MFGSKPEHSRLVQFDFRALRPLLVNTDVRVLGRRLPDAPPGSSPSSASSAAAATASTAVTDTSSTEPSASENNGAEEKATATVSPQPQEAKYELWIEDSQDPSIRYMEAYATLQVNTDKEKDEKDEKEATPAEQKKPQEKQEKGPKNNKKDRPHHGKKSAGAAGAAESGSEQKDRPAVQGQLKQKPPGRRVTMRFKTPDGKPYFKRVAKPGVPSDQAKTEATAATPAPTADASSPSATA